MGNSDGKFTDGSKYLFIIDESFIRLLLGQGLVKLVSI